MLNQKCTLFSLITGGILLLWLWQSGGPRHNMQPHDSRVQQAADTIHRRIHLIEKTEEVDLDGIMAELKTAGLPEMNNRRLLNVIAATNFATSGDPQWPSFILEAIAEMLRPKSTTANVGWVHDQFKTAKTIQDNAKWFKVLETIGHTGNQAGYIQILKELQRREESPKTKEESQMVGRVLAHIGTEPCINALLDCCNETNPAKQQVAEQSYGYVQNPKAIPAIAAVIGRSNNLQQIRVAIQMMGSISSPQSLQALQTLENNPNLEIAKTAEKTRKLLLQNNPGLTPGKSCLPTEKP